MVLARLLVPEDFGLVAIAMAIYAFIELFGAMGLGTVLIQRQSADDEDYNTAWTFKMLFGLVAAGSLLLLAPLVAGFYEDPRLQPRDLDNCPGECVFWCRKYRDRQLPERHGFSQGNCSSNWCPS